MLLELSSGIAKSDEYEDYFGGLEDDPTTPITIANTRSHQTMTTRTTTRASTSSQTIRSSTRSPLSPVSQPDSSENDMDEVSSCSKCNFKVQQKSFIIFPSTVNSTKSALCTICAKLTKRSHQTDG